ncbi:uncharacterized protein THITE_34861 [Thermothielavioides terrestris NRRL 8126]|uniref:Cell surface protein n=1 Tax=Thermothielavioides terrestris (strain ATCC 38088 / NRRL 8126) TaxID=578455 RepID=G2QYR3_THETT|nr:uncharacterized protein THITE_34861 [Thermothielavioides terrestris NRRL 8126]AEO66255.1 hypothetical protein THITE_34861 [Thermothielavioides terrestris NRRL 8126]
MHPSELLAVALLAGSASAHGVVTLIKGANGVDMPGLSVADGTPRDCATPICGAEADTSIIRDREISSGKASPLGRTQGGGPVDPAKIVSIFMGNASAAARRDNTAAGGSAALDARFEDGDEEEEEGGSTGKETNVAATAGKGASSGLPTCADDGTITMVFHQDGAGPLEAAVDGTSGGTDASAFQTAKVTQDVPGSGVAGLSLATTTDFPLKVQMPAGMTCDGTVAGVNNVCIVRVRNNALAGPFGGSAAFTQSAAARKRAIEYRMRKRAQVFTA